MYVYLTNSEIRLIVSPCKYTIKLLKIFYKIS